LVPVFVFLKDKSEMANLNNITLNPDFDAQTANCCPYRFHSTVLLLNDRIDLFVEASQIYSVAEKKTFCMHKEIVGKPG
jgi:hypothetical protein